MSLPADDDDCYAYLRLMTEESLRFGVAFLAWCLMSNHVSLVAVPAEEDSLARASGEAHRRYTCIKNSAAGVRQQSARLSKYRRC